MHTNTYPDPVLTPAEFERYVRTSLDATGCALADYESQHLERIEASDGGYTFDVTVRFSALGANFLVLIECKRQARPVEREEVLALHAKLHSVGAQKAMVFSTSGFQSGALEYAAAHGIATVHVVDGRSMYMTKGADAGPREPPAWANLPRVAGWLISGGRHSCISEDCGQYLGAFLRTERIADPR